jgi:glycosyltransferase involved in cell wall biosynthesis
MLPESTNSKKYSAKLTAIIPIAHIAGQAGMLKDILSQSSISNINIILVHDIKDLDNSPIIKRIYDKYSKENDIYIEGYYGNAGQARNAGFQLCKTEWVCFWDSDDQVYVSQFIAMVEQAKELNCEIAMGLISVKSKNNSKHPCLSDKLIKNVFFDLQIANFPAFTRMAFLTSLIKTTPFPDLKIGEDLIFLLSLNLPIKQIYLSNSEVYRYYIGSKNQTTFSYDIDTMYVLLLKILELIEKKQFTSKRMAIAMLNKIFIRIIKSESKWFLNRNKISTLNRVILVNLKNLFQFIVAIVYLTANRPKIIKAIHES